MKKWEYKEFSARGTPLEAVERANATLAKIGDEGWEVYQYDIIFYREGIFPFCFLYRNKRALHFIMAKRPLS